MTRLFKILAALVALLVTAERGKDSAIGGVGGIERVAPVDGEADEQGFAQGSGKFEHPVGRDEVEQGAAQHGVVAVEAQIGERGGSYSGVCPTDLEGSFVRSYESGRELYNLESRVANAVNRQAAAHRELEQAEHEIVDQSAVIVSKDATSEARAQALVSTKELAEKVGRLKGEINDLERDKLRYERDLEEYRAGLPPGG